LSVRRGAEIEYEHIAVVVHTLSGPAEFGEVSLEVLGVQRLQPKPGLRPGAQALPEEIIIETSL
jgi:hypothetical protein